MESLGEPIKRLPLHLPGMKRKARVHDTNKSMADTRPLAMFSFLPNRIRGHIVAMSGEFVGTFMFLFFALGATQAVTSESAEDQTETARLLCIALAFGFSFAVNAWVFFRVSGGLFNPAVCMTCRRRATH